MLRAATMICVVLVTLPLPARAASSRERPYRATAYDAALEVDPATHSVRGSVQIRFALREGVTDKSIDAIDLDCGELTIDAVSEAGTALVFEKRPDVLHITLARPWQPGAPHRLTVRYHGQPHAGFRFFPGGWYTVFTTQGWLPCDADPGHKATLTLQLTAPAGLRLYATGERGPTRTLADGRQRGRWRLAQPYPAYLFGMAAGPFRELCRRDRGATLCAAALPAHVAELPRVLDVTAAAFAFFSERAGIAYPFPGGRYDQLFVPGDVAQEAAGLALLGERYFGDLLREPHEDWSVVHELAHQWWGNWVTARSWTDFWLNEGLAMFMVAAAKEQRWGRLDYDQELALARRRYARALAKAPRAIAWDGWTRPAEMGGAITYSGGAL